MPYCQTFKQKIEEIKEKAKILENLLLEYKNTGNKEIIGEIDKILQEIEEFKKEFRNKATQLIEEFIQRRVNKNEEVEIIFDEKDFRFIINGNLDFTTMFQRRVHLNDFPNLIKEIKSLWVYNVRNLNLPNLEKTESIFAGNVQTIDIPKLKKARDIYTNAQTLNLPNLEEAWNIKASEVQILDLPKLKKANIIEAPKAQIINLPNISELKDIFFYKNNPNLKSLLNQAREWRTRGILKGKIKILNEKFQVTQEL